jgi:cell division septum initiation protein DivIVA
MPTFRLFRFLRRRMTIAAPRMAVRTHIPWYLRVLLWILILSFSTAFAAWIYDAGRRFAGFDRDEVQQELADLRSLTANLTQENSRLKGEYNAAGSKIAIEQTAQKNLAAQVQGLEAENTRLKEDLALFEGMVASDRAEGSFSIAGAKVSIENGQLRYRMLLSRGVRPGSILGRQPDPEFSGRLEFQFEPDPGGNGAMIRLPANEAAATEATRVRFRYFSRVEGVLPLPSGVRPRQVLVRLLEGDRMRASQSVMVSTASLNADGGAAAPTK